MSQTKVRDLDLWRYVTRTVTPYRPQRHPTPEPQASPQDTPAEKARDADFSLPYAPPAKRAPLPLKLGAVAAMDKRTGRRFARGEMAIDGQLDLHGLTLEQAHGALSTYIRRSHARGARCVIVVTGKGGSGKGEGRIRREALDWLNRPDLRALILAVSQARQQHGGAGALYVMLKRIRE